MKKIATMVALVAVAMGGVVYTAHADNEPEYVTVAWLLPIDYTTWDGLGQPSGNVPAIWPQTYHAHAETAAVDLDALDGMTMDECAVYQIDTYPASAGLHLVGALDWGDDHGAVISWKFLWSDDCTPDPEPTASPTPEPTASPTPEVTPEATPEPTVEPTPVVTPEPTPVVTPEPTIVLPPAISAESMCIGNDLHIITYEDDVPVSTEVIVNHADCEVVQPPIIEDTPPVVTPAAPIPADTGHGYTEHETAGQKRFAYGLGALSLALLGMGRFLAHRRGL